MSEPERGAEADLIEWAAMQRKPTLGLSPRTTVIGHNPSFAFDDDCNWNHVTDKPIVVELRSTFPCRAGYATDAGIAGRALTRTPNTWFSRPSAVLACPGTISILKSFCRVAVARCALQLVTDDKGTRASKARVVKT